GRAGGVPGGLGVFASAGEPVGCRPPRVVEGVVVAVADGGGDGCELTDVRAAVRGESQCPRGELLVQGVFEQAQRRISMRRIQAFVRAPTYAARTATGNQ